MTDQPLPFSFNEPDCVRSTDLGAYVLGGMNESDSLYMRVHIDSCAICTNELRDIRPISDLLSATDLAAAFVGNRLEPAPPTVRDRIVQQATSEYRNSERAPRGRFASHRRIAIASLLAFGLGAGSVLGGQNLAASPTKTQQDEGERIPFTKISLQRAPHYYGPPAKAWASVRDDPAGTYAYLWVSDFEVGKTYKWWFKKKDGSRVPLGSFVYPGKEDDSPWLICPGSTAIKRSELVAIGATDDDGIDVANELLPPAPESKKSHT